MRGTLSVRDYFLIPIENSSMNAEMKIKLYDSLQRQMVQYGGINLHESGDYRDTLAAEIKDYRRSEDAYDNSGNILSYRYSLSVDYTASGKKMAVSSVKILDAALTEDECKDSVADESVRNLIDKLRGDF